MDRQVALRAVEFFCSATQRATLAENNDAQQSRCTLIFYGGEPTVNYSALEAAARRARELPFPGELKLSIVTNGTVLDDATINLIKECRIDVSVSLDGPPGVTDGSRNEGTYARAMAGLRLLQDSGIQPGISCTLPASSLDQFEEILEWLLATGVSGLGFNLVARPGLGYDSPQYNSRATQLLIRAFEHFRERGIYEDRIMRKVRAFVEHRVYPSDCAACSGAQVVIAPDGNVGICHAFLGSRKTFIGSVFDNTFVPEEHEIWREWSKRSPLNMAKCSDCSCLGICGGGCPANTPNDIWEVSVGFCSHAHTILEWLIWDLFDQAQKHSAEIACSTKE